MDSLISEYIEKNKVQFLGELFDLCRIKSFTGGEEAEFERCKNKIVSHLSALGFCISIIPTPGKDMIYAERKGPVSKTLLFYNHYDVVPAGNRSLWKSDPFEPTPIGDRIFCRGISDHKGSLMARIHALTCFEKLYGKIPLTVKFLIEGDEEIGSPYLLDTVQKYREKLAADACLYPGWRRDEHGTPRINAGSRGSFTAWLSCQTAARDMHEANMPLVPNALTRVIQAVSSIFDEHQNVTIDGFYESVYRDRAMETAVDAIPFNLPSYKNSTGICALAGGIMEEEASRRSSFAPVASCFAVTSSSATKEVLPCEASAGLRFLLVPNQRPIEIFQLLTKHLCSHGFEDIAVRMEAGVIEPSYTDISVPLIQTVLQSSAEVYGEPPILVPVSSGSGPKFVFSNFLGIPTIADVGCGDAISNDHGVNESIRLDDYLLNIRHIAGIMNDLAQSVE